MNEGPSTRHIPAETYQSCSDCIFYKHQLVRSGRDPEYKNHCNHPAVPKEHQFHFAMIGNLPEDGKTPEWCPVINSKKNA
jgi:hypothetical protein